MSNDIYFRSPSGDVDDMSRCNRMHSTGSSGGRTGKGVGAASSSKHVSVAEVSLVSSTYATAAEEAEGVVRPATPVVAACLKGNFRPHSAPVHAAHHSAALSMQVAEPWTRNQSSLHTELGQLKRSLFRLTNPFFSFFREVARECSSSEVEARCVREVELLVEQEAFLRGMTYREERVHREDVERHRSSIAIVPWCSGGCRYCCMSREDWAHHVNAYMRSQVALLVELEWVGRRSLMEAGEMEWRGVEYVLISNCRTTQLLEAQAATLFAEAAHVGSIITLHEQQHRDEFEKEKEALLVSRGNSEQHRVLREREVAVESEQRSAAAKLDRSVKQTCFVYLEQETSHRMSIQKLEEQRRLELHSREVQHHTLLLQAQWGRDNSDMIEELDALRLFKKSVEAKIQQDEVDRIAGIHREWETEFLEIKKLKKQGPPKGTPSLPPCARCNQIPLKDAYTHRIQECLERPAQCTKCMAIMPLSQLNSVHKTDQCPQRVVECIHCHNFYRACYLFGTHQRFCPQLLAECHLLAQDCAPFFHQLVQQGMGGALVAWRRDDDDDAELSSTALRVVSVNGEEVHIMEDIERILTQMIKTHSNQLSKVQVDVVVIDCIVGGAADEPSSPASQKTFHASLDFRPLRRDSTVVSKPCSLCVNEVDISKSTAPHAAFFTAMSGSGVGASELCREHLRQIVTVVEEDVAQYCKPQLERKSGAKGKKK